LEDDFLSDNWNREIGNSIKKGLIKEKKKSPFLFLILDPTPITL